MPWLAVFCNPESLPPDACRRDRLLYWFLTTFLKDGFRHVFLMRRAHGFDGWIVFNPHSGCTDVLEVQGDDYARFVQDMEDRGHATILEVTARRPERWVPRGVLSCVSSVKHVLGVECGNTATPWQLYNTLKGEQPMGGMFSAPKAPDTSAADAARAQAEADRDAAKKKNDAKMRNSKNRSRGRSLLAFAGMEGVQPGAKDKLGQ